MTKAMNQRFSPRSGRRLFIILVLIACGMFAFGFMLVPIYNVFCKVTGLNGKTGGYAAYNPNAAIDKSRTVTVQFVTTTNAGLPWDFYPLTDTVKLHPGEMVRVAFFAKNNSPKTMTVQAIPSVSPGQVARYLKKTECFCFTRQTFKAGQAEEMPVLFHLDTDFPKDISTMTLSYTMFDADSSVPNRNVERGHIIDN